MSSGQRLPKVDWCTAIGLDRVGYGFLPARIGIGETLGPVTRDRCKAFEPVLMQYEVEMCPLDVGRRVTITIGNIKFNKEKEFESLGGENLQLAVTVEESEIVLNVGKDIVNGQVESGGCSGCKNINEISEKGNSGGEVVIVEEVKDVDEEVEGVVCGNSFAVLSDDGGSLLTTFVYAKCSQLEQRVLWEQLHGSSTFNMPWVVLGDFNTIRSDTERVGGRPRNCSSMAEFNECISSWGLLDLRFKVKYGDAKALLLKRISSDHSPILLQVVAKIERYGLAPFHFQNMWTSHVGFLDVGANLENFIHPSISEVIVNQLKEEPTEEEVDDVLNSILGVPFLAHRSWKERVQ
ncbi:hypothetical protein Q3G72_026945 [Acer saccharum]|nr:hypothetical protein Q3G72_026945 [Acer saccharum]